MTSLTALKLQRNLGAHGAAVLAVKAALSTLVQRRNGAREPARVLYYRAHSLLRTLRHHFATSPHVAA